MADKEKEDFQFYDEFFRVKKKNGEYKLVNSPHIQVPVVDTHAHVQYLKDSAYSLARAGVHEVAMLCDIVDIFEDGDEPFDMAQKWFIQGSIKIRHMSSRC